VIEERSSRCAALLLRLTLGVLFIAHLYWKFEIFPGGVAKWWSGLQTNGYPWFVPWYVISAEFAGAVLLIPGIYTRWVSLYAIPLMIGATQFWWVRRGFYFTSAGGELPLLWASTLLVQALLGDGPYAVKAGALHMFRRSRRLTMASPSV
jgi:putative oxidoreductase